MNAIDDLLAKLKAEKADACHRAERDRSAADAADIEAQILASRIQGIEETRAALSPNGEAPKARRNIRALVKARVEETGNRDPAALAEMIGCRVSQVKDALDHLRRSGDS